MNRSDAHELAEELAAIDSTSAGVIRFSDKEGLDWEPWEEDGGPDDDLYGVSYYAYDALIPQSVIEAVASYDTGGIYIHPDPGLICP
jgi:hypothetical protein